MHPESWISLQLHYSVQKNGTYKFNETDFPKKSTKLPNICFQVLQTLPTPCPYNLETFRPSGRKWWDCEAEWRYRFQRKVSIQIKESLTGYFTNFEETETSRSAHINLRWSPSHQWIFPAFPGVKFHLPPVSILCTWLHGVPGWNKYSDSSGTDMFIRNTCYWTDDHFMLFKFKTIHKLVIPFAIHFHLGKMKNWYEYQNEASILPTLTSGSLISCNCEPLLPETGVTAEPDVELWRIRAL